MTLISPAFDWLGPVPASYNFYKNTIKLFYDDEDGKHQYYRYDADGNVIIVTGVTTACKVIDKSAALVQWSANMATQYIRDAFDFFLNAENKPWADMNVATLEKWLGEAKYAHKNFKEAAGETGH